MLSVTLTYEDVPTGRMHATHALAPTDRAARVLVTEYGVDAAARVLLYVGIRDTDPDTGRPTGDYATGRVMGCAADTDPRCACFLCLSATDID
jgi:hypothetical protein